MQNRNYTIRTMHRDEVQIAVEWAAREGWNPGLADADCFYAADPNGFLIGLLDEEPAAPVYLDVPQVNRAAVELAERCDMKIIFETARMYTREEPSLPMARLFGVTTFELG